MGSIQEKVQQTCMGRERCEDIHRLLLWKKNCEFLGLSLLRNSRQNEASSLSPGKIVLHTMELLGLKSKTFFITPGNANSFFNWTLEHNFSIYPELPRNFRSSTLPPVWNFYCSSSFWLFGWNSPVHWHWAIPDKLQTGEGGG